MNLSNQTHITDSCKIDYIGRIMNSCRILAHPYYMENILLTHFVNIHKVPRVLLLSYLSSSMQNCKVSINKKKIKKYYNKKRKM